jgi:hypothetical protein
MEATANIVEEFIVGFDWDLIIRMVFDFTKGGICDAESPILKPPRQKYFTSDWVVTPHVLLTFMKKRFVGERIFFSTDCS